MSKPKKSDSAAFTITSDKELNDHKAIEALRASFARLHAGIDIFSQKDFFIQDPTAIENAEGTGMPSWSVGSAHHIHSLIAFLLSKIKFLSASIRSKSRSTSLSFEPSSSSNHQKPMTIDVEFSFIFQPISTVSIILPHHSTC